MESISRISSMLETARDLTLDAARDAGASRRTPSRAIPPAQLKKLLDSRSERDVLEGLRKVISMTYRRQNTLPYFSSVVKNIASPALEVKKLVYAYLLRHAEAEPDTALLSINTIQKSLADANPQLRALALRVMSGIRVPVISQIVSLGIKRGAGDMSPYVRRAAALAIPKCYRLDPATLPQLLGYLQTLLADKQYYVAGAAVQAFLDVCPDRIDLIHKHYRSLIRKLVDMDEWSQLATLRLMLVYARRCFPRRTRRVKKSGSGSAIKEKTTTTTTTDFYADDSDTDNGEEPDADENDYTEEVILDPDLDLLLRSISPLLQSRNSAVVLAVARCYLYLGNTTYLTTAVGPLISLLRGAQDVQHIALHNIVQISLLHPAPFVPYTTHFLLRATDPPFIWRPKLEVLALLFPHSPPQLRSLTLAELSHLSHGHGPAPLVRDAVRAMGRCAQTGDARTGRRCLRLLLRHLGSADARLVAESLDVIRLLIQRDPAAHTRTVVRLAKNLDVLASPQARACIVWLVGEFAGLDPENNVAADVLRILVKGYADERDEVKLQIVLLAAKVYVHHLNTAQSAKAPGAEQPEQRRTVPSAAFTGPEGEEGGFGETHVQADAHSPQAHAEKEHPIPMLWRYVLLLARYSTSYDLRDRARLYRALLAVPSSTELASLLLLAPKPVPQAPSPSESRKGYALGSASLVVGNEGGVGGLRGYEAVPEWVKEGEEPDARLRDQGEEGRAEYKPQRVVPAGEKLDSAVATEKGRTNGAKEKSLDDWLAEGDEGEEEGSEGSTEEESSEEDGTSEEDWTDEKSDEEEHDRLVK